MLRVTIAENAFLLEGELAGPSAAEAENAWKDRIATRQPRRWVVDLSEVTFIDETGEELLVKMWSDGAEFVGGGLSVREQLESLGILVTKRPHDTQRRASESKPMAPGQQQRNVEFCSSSSMDF